MRTILVPLIDLYMNTVRVWLYVIFSLRLARRFTQASGAPAPGAAAAAALAAERVHQESLARNERTLNIAPGQHSILEM